MRILLGSLLPIALGFLVAKTGFGSRSTAHAVDDVTNHFTGAVQRLKNSAVHGTHVHEQDRLDTHQESETHPEQKPAADPAPALRNRSFFGII